jgi:hypothetical protein
MSKLQKIRIYKNVLDNRSVAYGKTLRYMIQRSRTETCESESLRKRKAPLCDFSMCSINGFAAKKGSPANFEPGLLLEIKNGKDRKILTK